MLYRISVFAILLLSKVAFAALNDYIKQKKAGKDPVFYKDSIKGLENIECWEHSSSTLKKLDIV